MATPLSCRLSVTTGPLAYGEPQLDRVVACVGKGDGAMEGFGEAKP